MKAVILAAGLPGRDFPQDSKPKCLYHSGGRMLLDIAVNSVQQAGIADIRLVVGYKADAVREFVKARRWNLDVVVNDAWATDSVRSIETGLEGADTDVILLCADLLIDSEIIRAFSNTAPKRLAWVRSMVPWDHDSGFVGYDDVYRNDIDNSILRIPKHLLGIFQGARERAERFLKRYRWRTDTGPGTGVYFGAAVTETFHQYRPIEEVVVQEPIRDVDSFWQTDEAKIQGQVRRFLAGRGAP
jgi:choline kinase